MTFLEELKRANSALGQANVRAVDPWRFMCGALLDALTALEELVEDSTPGDACGCPCHQVVQPGLVPCPRCEEVGR